MNTLFLYDTKTMRGQINTKIFAGDNLITKINVQIPDNIGGYPKRECEYNLRAIIPEGNLSYMINPSQPYFYITNDITEKAQTVKLMMIITHEGNVIGRTNTVDLIVNEPAEAPDPPLTPREEFDEVIAEQRAEIAEQAETISTQDETITQQGEQITELNGEVTELTNENTRLENLTDTQRETIQYMVDNPPAPKLETPNPISPPSEDVTIRPAGDNVGFTVIPLKGMKLQEKTAISTDIEQEITPSEGYDGLSKVTVQSINGGLFFTKIDEYGNIIEITVRNWNTVSSTTLSLQLSPFTLLKKIIFINCPKIINIPDICTGLGSLEYVILPENLLEIGIRAFQNCTALTSVTIPSGLTSFASNCFNGCSNLVSINIPASLTTVGTNVFLNCKTLQNVIIENGFNCNNLNLSASTLYSVETIVSWLEALADRTGEKAYTLTIGKTNLNKLTNEQKAIAINKNWNLA